MGANQVANDKKEGKYFRAEDDIDHGIEQLQPLVHSESWILAGRLVLHLHFYKKVTLQSSVAL